MIKKASWVQIKKIILSPEERAERLPLPTKKVPLVMWVKGFLQKNAEIGELVNIKTITGRLESGFLVCENPAYMHTYGQFVPEILEIDQICRQTLFGCDDNE